MRWMTAVLLACLFASTPAFAAVSSVLTHTFQSAAVATGNGTALDVSKYNSLAVQIIIATTATVTFEGTVDNSNWVSLACTSVGSTSATLVTSATASGLYQCNTAGLSSVRMRISAWTSGAVTVTGVLTTAVASKKGGGSGGTGASTSDHFVTTRDDTADVPNSVNLGLLSTGFLKCVTAASICTLSTDTAVVTTGSTNSYAAGMKQTFTPNATNAGINVGSTTAAPSVPVNGDVYYDSVLLKFQCRENGAWVNCIGSGGSPAFSAVTAGTNTAALVVGTAGSLTFSGTGTINANKLNGTTIATLNQDASHFLVGDGSWGTVTPPTFAQITTGSNTTATMTCGAGCTVTTTSTGVVNANQIRGTAISGTNMDASHVLAGDGSWTTASGSGAPDPTAVRLTEEFCGGIAGTGTIGQLGWRFTDAVGTGTIALGAGSGPNLCQYTVTSGATSGNASYMTLHDYGGNGFITLGDHTGTVPWEANFVFKCSSTASITCIAALMSNSTNVIVPINYIGLRYDTNATDTNFMFVCTKTGVGTTAVDTTIAADTTFHRLKVFSNTANDIRYILYSASGVIQKDGSGSNQCSTSANIPSADLTMGFLAGTRTTAAKTITADYASYSRTVGR